MSDNFPTLLIERPAEGVLKVTFNRPQVMNAISTQVGHDLLAVLTGPVQAADVRVVFLTGSGERAFCAGGDLKERHGMTDEAWRCQHVLFEEVNQCLLDCPKPIIAAVNGVAYGGGCEIALCCDFIYAARTAQFALTETRLGIMPGGGGTQTLPRAIGARRAKELIYSAQPFSAEQAAAWGMVNKICEPADLLAEVLAVAQTIAGNAPLSIEQAKKSIDLGLQMDLRSGLRFEIEAYNRLVVSRDRHEGVAAFNEKRKPKFVGR